MILLVCAALSGASVASAKSPFPRGPFPQLLGPSGVTIKVELLVPGTVTVEVEGPDGAKKTEKSEESKRFHSVRIDGLSPSTAYKYRVISDEKSEQGQLTTAPSDSRPFKFLAYGDSRSDAASHAAVISAMASVPSDFLVNTGDMVARGDEEDDWRVFFEIENSLLRDRCVFASIGNHELAGENNYGALAFLRYFAPEAKPGKESAKLFGSFRWSNTRFFLLNAMDNWSGEERAWLQDALGRALSEPGLEHRFAVLHQGPFSSGPHGGNKRLHDNGVVSILKEGKVDLILAGHDHAYERGAGEGLKYVVSGGAGAPLYPRKFKAKETATYESVHHFLEVSVDGPKVSIVARRASGSVIETCGFVGSEAWSCEGAQPSPASSDPKVNKEVVQKSGACACSVPGATDAPARPFEISALLAFVGGAVRRLRSGSSKRAGGSRRSRH